MFMQKRALFIFMFSLGVVSFLSSSGFTARKVPQVPPAVKKMVIEAKKSAKSIDMEALKAAIDKKEDAALIDVRVPKEYATGHIPGSINIPRGLLEFLVWAKVVGYPEKTDTSKKIYLYCRTGVRAALAVKTLEELGFTNVVLVDMKIAEWRKAGYPLEK
jgi:rhodanese-related sulfurtransferase